MRTPDGLLMSAALVPIVMSPLGFPMCVMCAQHVAGFLLETHAPQCLDCAKANDWSRHGMPADVAHALNALANAADFPVASIIRAAAATLTARTAQ